MKYGAILATILFILSTIALCLPDYADAARMGGGRSFGSRPSMSRPAQPPAAQRSPIQNQTAQPSVSKPGMGMMGGLLGGLLAGTLLGSILGGSGFNGGGFMDLILLAILAFIAYKLFQRFKQRTPQQSAAAASGYGGAWKQPNAMNRQSNWDNLRGSTNDYTPPTVEQAIDVPAGFDTEDFLRGAKMAYTRMQKSWDNRDLADIANFVTPTVFQEIQSDAAKDPNPGKTDLVLVNAQLLGVENEGQNQRAQVYFDVLMREDPAQPQPVAVREIWHFLREGQNGNWKLDGIQQVE